MWFNRSTAASGKRFVARKGQQPEFQAEASAAEYYLHLLTSQIAISLVCKAEEKLHMFEIAVQEKRTGILWGVVVGLIAFVALLGTGYIFVS